jgi:hypothetical protein
VKISEVRANFEVKESKDSSSSNEYSFFNPIFLHFSKERSNVDCEMSNNDRLYRRRFFRALGLIGSDQKIVATRCSSPWPSSSFERKLSFEAWFCQA